MNTNINKWKRLLQKARLNTPVVDNTLHWEPIDRINIPNIGQLSNCTFVGKQIQKHAKRTINSCWKVTNKLTIFVSDSTKDVAPNIAYACLILMNVLESINQNKHKDSPTVVLLLLDIPKTYNDNTELLATVDNINSGAYFPMLHTILIWRIEEILKVIVHEHVHAYEWDTLASSNAFLYNFHEEMFHLTTDSARNPKEALTEVITTIIVSALDSIMNNVPFDVEYEKHVLWSTQQACFVWRNMKRNEYGYVSQSTDVLSYYVIKCLLLHLATFKKEFKETILDTNDESTHSLLKELRTSSFWDYMSNLEYEYDCGSKTTLRMSPPETLEKLLRSSPLYQNTV